MPTIEQDIIATLIIVVIVLLVYVLRTSGKREESLVRQKEQLIDLLDKYADALKDLTTQIVSLSNALRAMENRVERIESLMSVIAGARGGISVSDNSRVSIGRDATGGDSAHNKP